MKRWLAPWSINEDEPTWPQVAVAGVLFVGVVLGLPFYLWLLAPTGVR